MDYGTLGMCVVAYTDLEPGSLPTPTRTWVPVSFGFPMGPTIGLTRVPRLLWGGSVETLDAGFKRVLKNFHHTATISLV